MIALAFIALLIWEGIFPDRRDGRILSALPIRSRTFVLARLAALAALFAIVTVGSASLPTLAFVPIGNPAAHFISFLGIASFSFFAIVAVQCLVLNIVGRAAAQRLAIVLQIVVVITILQALTVVPPEFLFTGDAQTPPTGASRWLPSMWFICVHQVITGRGNAASNELATMGVAAALGTPLLTVLLYAATYRRLLRRAIEGEATTTSPRSALAMVRASMRRLLVTAIPNGTTRAVCFFVLHTIGRSRRHKMLLAMYMGVAIAMVLSIVLPRAVQRGWEGFARPDAALLSAPLLLVFFATVGIRALIAIPVEIKANWIFRVGEAADAAAVISGVAAAMLGGAIVPVALGAAAIAAMLWGPSMAIEHGLFVAALGWLLAELLVLPLTKFPFACTYLPGGSRMRVLWPFYMMAFTIFTFGMGRYQALAFRYGQALLEETLAVMFAAAAFRLLRRMRLQRSAGLRFEAEDPLKLFEGFRLSESLAAERARRHSI